MIHARLYFPEYAPLWQSFIKTAVTQGADDTLYGKLSWTQILESLQKCWNSWTMFFKLGWVTQSAYLAYVAGEVMTCLKML